LSQKENDLVKIFREFARANFRLLFTIFSYYTNTFITYILPMAERSLLLLKPDVIHRSLIGTIIARIEARNFKIVALKMFDLKRETLDEHYAHIVSKPFYPEIVSYMTMGPVVGIIVEGKNVVAGMRQLCGATNPSEAEMGTLRADYSNDIGANIIHASDSVENAETEIKRFFDAADICSYERKVIA